MTSAPAALILAANGEVSPNDSITTGRRSDQNGPRRAGTLQRHLEGLCRPYAGEGQLVQGDA